MGSQTVTLFEPDKPEPTLGWGIAGDYYIYGVGVGWAERCAKHLLTGDKLGIREVLEKGPGAKAAKTPAVSVMVLRTEEVAKALDGFAGQLKEKTAGMGIDKVLESVADLVATFGDVALSVQPVRDGLEFSLIEQLQ